MVNIGRWWAVVVPPVAALVLAGVWGRDVGAGLLSLVAVALILAVGAAVHHAEVVAHRVGEPFGTLILAVGLIVMIMSSSGPGAGTLARDTVFAAFIIVCNGVVGLCLLVGGVRHRVVEFRVEGVTAALATLTALATMALVLPTFTTSSPGPSFSPAQLAFAGTMSLILYSVFVFMQTVRHRNYFLPPGGQNSPTEDEHAPPPPARTALISLGLLVVCLIAVVGLAKT